MPMALGALCARRYCSLNWEALIFSATAEPARAASRTEVKLAFILSTLAAVACDYLEELESSVAALTQEGVRGSGRSLYLARVAALSNSVSNWLDFSYHPGIRLHIGRVQEHELSYPSPEYTIYKLLDWFAQPIYLLVI